MKADPGEKDPRRTLRSRSDARIHTVGLTRLGSIDVLDIEVISRYLGREFAPFPFTGTRPHRFTAGADYTSYARGLPDRFNHGDLRIFRSWFDAHMNADIRVECRVQFIPADTPFVRVTGHRLGQTGFLAVQRPDIDVVDVYTVSPYDLGAAIAGLAELTEPGSHANIVIPEYIPQSLRDDTNPQRVALGPLAKGVLVIPSARVSAYATVQSHRHPARTWGVDQDSDAVVWVRISDDGEYIYVPGFHQAIPMTRRLLAERVDRLIAADVAVLRGFRGG